MLNHYVYMKTDWTRTQHQTGNIDLEHRFRCTIARWLISIGKSAVRTPANGQTGRDRGAAGGPPLHVDKVWRIIFYFYFLGSKRCTLTSDLNTRSYSEAPRQNFHRGTSALTAVQECTRRSHCRWCACHASKLFNYVLLSLIKYFII